MSEFEDAVLLWKKAMDDAAAAIALDKISFNGVANRAYYAVFHAVSALLFLEGKGELYKKHQAVESAVHRDFVLTGKWEKETGAAYSALYELRLSGDYGIAHDISEDEAAEALNNMRLVLGSVGKLRPDVFVIGKL